MFWYGGFRGPAQARREPRHSSRMWLDVTDCWLVGSRQEQEIRTARTAIWSVAIVGSCGASGAEVAHLATQGVRDEVARRWPGAYAVVETTDEATTVWTDLGGVWPIYTLADNGVYWASSSRALAALTAQELDTYQLAVELLAPAVARMSHDRSMFAGVSLVPPGHRVVLSNTGHVDVQQVWRPQSRSGDLTFRLRAELSVAAAVRVEGAKNPTVDLSGGLDSTSLALLAAERLCPDRTITGVTVHATEATTEGDLGYAREAGAHPGITHRFMPISATGYEPYRALDTVPVTDEPAPSTIAYKHFAAQLDWMRDQFGTDCHMTGDGGDSLLCTEPIMLADLVASRRLRRAWTESVAWARLRRSAVWPLLADSVRTARSDRPAALRSLARAWRTGRPGRNTSAVNWVPAALQPGWSTAEARELAASLVTGIAAHSAPLPRTGFTSLVAAEAMSAVGRTARADVQIAEHHGVPLHNPFLDSRVVDAYLSIPLDARPGPAEYKPVLRRAMDDLFSPALARRTTKGSFTSDFYQGMRTNLDALRDLADGHLAVLGLVDPARLRHELSSAAAGVPGAFESVDPVISAEAWLRALHSAEPVEWSTTPRAGEGAS
ncbi:albusnodin/ikarugamycin family macrolactam cyclase [Lentzea tibetensis]|uniref:asparagine synthase (glutamine-hydrolyzing) n=1 Tax=Lentzea tibetensis TaxID=2591470 RepID=A0A563EFD0_9PSEU|nr:albusnodin/ikarugamycin family macrolactam cyclase [Lentzea tibetensis]TWP43537.1 albusnodin/ikarugamycin family macrolactam cyclase [Lentzea tibetensis]